MRYLLVIVSLPEREAWANELISAAGAEQSLVVVSSPVNAAQYIAEQKINPSHVVFDVGNRGKDILTEIDTLAQQCETGTRVVAVGDTNDIGLYREIINRGVIDYLPMPAAANDVIKALLTPPKTAEGGAGSNAKRVMVFMSAASGDGASTIALNTAYEISKISNGNTVLVDMDYQFGMVAKHLSLQNQYGIRELFDYPGRGVDGTLIKRMVVNYGKLHVITAPPELRYLPAVESEAILDLVVTLQQNYNNIIIDLPHVWLPWVSTATQLSTHLILVAQLWLKSVSHAARIMRGLREHGVPPERVTALINRSGAKFKEAIESKDFERVCGVPIRYTIANDIKSVVAAEASAKTIMELSTSPIMTDIQRLARGLLDIQEIDSANNKRGGSLLSILKG